MSYEVIRTVRQLIEKGIGDSSRLVHILDRLESGKYLYLSDQKYLENLLTTSQNIPNKTILTTPSEFEGLEAELKDINVQLEKILHNKESNERKITERASIPQMNLTDKSPTISGDKSIRHKRTDVTLVLSVVLGLICLQGIGHIYIGKFAKGIGIFVLSLNLYILSVSYFLGLVNIPIPYFLQSYTLPILITGYLGLYVFQILDSNKLCTAYNAYITEHGKIPPWW